ncbi:MAG TPA: bifunctional phosphopantothenoylcysteine decarboxylase/phosphopantothenate--cysteine ligase CoaBC [bacterium]|nr:bifunctional phosphopantothenoylcysteine decarboxylase/phosphopantothenate--cysteine ligase CoaBC [bacterium]
MAKDQAQPKILLGITGSIAAWKSLDLVRELRNRGADVAVVMTEAGARFVGPLSFETMTGNPVSMDLFDARGKGMLPSWVAGSRAARLPVHLALAECADLIVVAPASATTIGKMAHGIADNLLTTILLATSKPVALAPAMNTAMWLNPATISNVATLVHRGVHVLEPDSGLMAWEAEGEGPGRLPEPADLAARIARILETRRQLQGEKVVVSAGGTQEPIDAVRVVTNRSSGRMGTALAEEARDRGAEVVLVAASMSVPHPAGVRIVPARTAASMKEAMVAEAKNAEIVLMAAAVADWRPKNPDEHKKKKSSGPPAIEFEATEDILLHLRQEAKRAFRVGFALETENSFSNGSKKLKEKDLDLLVVNDATQHGAGPDTTTNRVTLLARDGSAIEVPLLPKREVAARILDRIAEIRIASGRSK